MGANWPMVSSKQDNMALWTKDSQYPEIKGDSLALSFVEFKKSLGTGANRYTDEQIECIRLAFDKIADATFDRWLYQRNTDKMAINISQ